jgi:hypothetical protein
MIGDHGLEFDTPEWCALRNEKMQEWVGDASAVEFFVMFGDICELFDDVIDQDKPITETHAVRVLFSIFSGMPFNRFFEAYKHQLVPIIITGINAWLDANELEKGSENDKVFAYVLRDWYVELLSFIIYTLRGQEYLRGVSMEIRYFFTHHETLEAYREKFK